MAAKSLVSSLEIISNIKTNQNLNQSVKYLYKQYYGLLEKYVLKNSGSKEDAEDVIQETMVAFIDMVQREKYRGESEIGTFLYAIARNIWLGKIRKNNADNNRNELWANEIKGFESDITFQIEKQESLKVIENLFSSIGETCKKILTMFYYQEASMKEILLEVNFENEQVLRNKKSKCMKALTDKIEINPKLSEYLKKALQTLK